MPNQFTADDITGRQFGDLTAVRRVGSLDTGASTKAVWEFRCVCGRAVRAVRSDVTTGHKRSCGCLRGRQEHWNYSHGGAKGGRTRTYQCWLGMRKRAYDGEAVPHDPRWDDFVTFQSDMGECPPGLTLDRIDHRGPYTKENCRWADRTTQTRNRRNTRRLTYRGETRPVAEWCEILGLPYNTVMQRLHVGADAESALRPLAKRPRRDFASAEVK